MTAIRGIYSCDESYHHSVLTHHFILLDSYEMEIFMC